MFNDFFIYAEPSLKTNKIRIIVSKKGLEIKYLVGRISLNRLTTLQKNLLVTIKKLICEVPLTWSIMELSQGYTISRKHIAKDSYYPLRFEIINDNESCLIELFNEDAEKDLAILIDKILSNKK